MSEPVSKEEAEGFYGDRIRTLRKSKRKTLTQLAKDTNLSSGYISQIERGLACPSITALNSISKVLGVSLHFFFKEEPESNDIESDFVVRKDNRRVISYDNGIIDQLMTPKSNEALSLVRGILPPGMGSDSYSHKGSKAILVEAGCLDVWVGGRHFTLNPGDTVSFSSTEEHRYTNNGEQDAIAIWFVTPAAFS